MIEALGNSDGPKGVTALAAELDLTTSNVHRLLTTLAAHDFACKSPNERGYILTTKLWEIGSTVIHKAELLEIANPVMRALSSETRETVHLSILRGTEVLYVAKIEGSHHIRAHTSVGSRAPAWCVATGKAMLAALPDQIRDKFEFRFEKFTNHSPTSMADLQRDLDRVVRQGHCIIEHGQWHDGISAVASVIHDHTEQPIAALGISGPDSRLTPQELQRIAPRIVEAANGISAALGYLK